MGKQYSVLIETRSGVLLPMIAISVADQRNFQNRALVSAHSFLEVEGLMLGTFT
jgi:hypothetical protein